MDGKGFMGMAFFIALIAVAVAVGMWLNRKYLS